MTKSTAGMLNGLAVAAFQENVLETSPNRFHVSMPVPLAARIVVEP